MHDPLRTHSGTFTLLQDQRFDCNFGAVEKPEIGTSGLPNSSL